MGGKGSGTSRKRKTLPRAYMPDLIEKLDQRSAPVIAMRGHLAEIAEDRAGAETMSRIARDLLTRYVYACARVTEIETGETPDDARWATFTDRIIRLGTAIGLARVPKPTEDLHTYMARRTAESKGGDGKS